MTRPDSESLASIGCPTSDAWYRGGSISRRGLQFPLAHFLPAVAVSTTTINNF